MKEIRYQNNINYIADKISKIGLKKCITISYIKNISENVGRALKRINFEVLFTIPKNTQLHYKKGNDECFKTDRINL